MRTVVLSPPPPLAVKCPRIVYTDLNSLFCKMSGHRLVLDCQVMKVTFEQEGPTDGLEQRIDLYRKG
jgi:hypothetical protein